MRAKMFIAESCEESDTKNEKCGGRCVGAKCGAVDAARSVG
jgi:hypothetical protein